MNLFSQYLLTCFKIGYVKYAPGTVGSIFALLIWLILFFLYYITAINIIFFNISIVILLIILTISGSILTKRYQIFKQNINIDSSAIVLDELVGQFIALHMAFNYIINYYINIQSMILLILMSFVFFRFLDITKPFVIGYCDKNIKNGFGVFLDDILAGIFAGIITIVSFKILFLLG